MDIRHFITFKTIAELKNFTKAGEQLNYTQSTLSSHIQDIEEELNGKVFDESGKNVILTDLGEKLLVKVNEILEKFDEIEALKISDEQQEATITLGTQESISLYKLNKVMRVFQESYPNVKVNVEVSYPEDIINKLNNGEVDIAVVIDKKMEHSNFVIGRFSEEKIGLVVNAKHFEDIEDLKHEKFMFVHTRRECKFNRIYDDYLKEKYADNINNFMEVISIETIKYNIMNDNGVALLPYIAVELELESEKMHFFELDLDEKDRLYVQMAYPKNKKKSPAVKNLIEMIHDSLSEED